MTQARENKATSLTFRLKTWPKFFNATALKQKSFEVRRADRDFQPMDSLKLEEFDPDKGKYTGRYIYVVILAIYRDIPGLLADYCAMEVRRITEVQIEESV